MDVQLRGRLIGWTEKNGGYAMRQSDKKYVVCLVLNDFDWGGIVWTVLWNCGLFYLILDVDVIGQG